MTQNKRICIINERVFYMTVSNLLKLCSYEDIEKKLTLHYNDVNTEEFRKLYLYLSEMTINNPMEEDFYICITAHKILDDENTLVVDLFDENDKEIYFDVSGYEIGNDILFSISSMSYREFLQSYIDKNTFKKFSPESILTHTLWEITSYGFEDRNSD